jgi:hypothetical protein
MTRIDVQTWKKNINGMRVPKPISYQFWPKLFQLTACWERSVIRVFLFLRSSIQSRTTDTTMCRVLIRTTDNHQSKFRHSHRNSQMLKFPGQRAAKTSIYLESNRYIFIQSKIKTAEHIVLRMSALWYPRTS